MPVLAHDRGFAISSCGNLLVNVWKEPATLARLAELRRCQQLLVERAPAGVAALVVLFGDAITPGQAERAAGNRIAQEFRDVTRAAAYVIDGEGFKSAALRSVVAGLQLLSRPGYPIKVFAHVGPAIEWLAPQARPPLAVAELRAAVEDALAAATAAGSGLDRP